MNASKDRYDQDHAGPVLPYAEDYGDEYPSILDLVGQWDAEEKRKVCQYLFSKRFLAAVAPLIPYTISPFTGERLAAGNKMMEDDHGTTWNDELAFYVLYNDVMLPEWFIERACTAVDSGLIGTNTWWKGKYRF